MQKVLDLLLPPTCPGCGTEGEALCRRCRAHMARRLDEPAGVPIGLPSNQPAGIVQLEWCSSFNGPARASVHALKYDGERRLVGPTRRAHGSALAARRHRRRRAGAGACSRPEATRAWLRPGRAACARRRRDLSGCRSSTRCERAAKHHGSAPASDAARGKATWLTRSASRRATPSDVQGRWIVLVDDVVTSGATLAGCAAALHEAGAYAVSALTLARER